MSSQKKQGPVQRFISSIFGMLIGFALFLGAFVLLWINEGRVDLSKIADDAVPVTAGALDPAQEGQLVAVSGTLRGDEQLGDSPYLRPGPYLELERVAEMYAWEEDEDNDNGSTSYSYRRTWTSSPQDSSTFQRPNGHFNPPMAVKGASYRAGRAWVGDYELVPEQIFFMHPEWLSLTPEITVDRRPVVDDYIFLGKGSLNNPEVGDIRLSYRAFPAGGSGTAFGRQEGGQIVTYRHDDGETLLYRAYAMDREGALADMHREYLTNLWLTRGGGFLMMWIGMLLFLGPLRRLLDFIPLVGRAGNFLIGVITFLIALFLSLVTIVVAFVAHNLLLLITILALIIGGVLFWRWRASPARAAA